jgi:hypothetical protein
MDENRNRTRNERRRALAVALSTATLVLSAVLLARVLPGGWVAPIPAWAACIVCCATAVAGLAAHVLRSGLRPETARSEAARFAEFLLVVGPAGATAFALFPHDSGWQVGLIAGVLAATAGLAVGAEALALLVFPERDGEEISNFKLEELEELHEFDESDRPTAVVSADGPRPELLNLVAARPSDDSGTVLQSFTRTLCPSGDERIEGGVAVHFAAGERQAVAHLAFCPPLEAVPEVHCEAADGEAVRLRVSGVQPWGARIEVKRSGGCGKAATVQVEYVAVWQALRSAA